MKNIKKKMKVSYCSVHLIIHRIHKHLSEDNQIVTYLRQKKHQQELTAVLVLTNEYA
jgi:hypothetical protein